MTIEYSKDFIKLFIKSPVSIQEAFKNKLKIFIDNKFHPSLHNHPLKGQLKGLRSISISDDWRAIFEEFNNGDTVFFIIIGNHNTLYK